MSLRFLCLSSLLALLWVDLSTARAQEPVPESSASTSAETDDPAAAATPEEEVLRAGVEDGSQKAGATAPGGSLQPPASEVTPEAWLSRFRRIFFYERHAPRLVPRNFWPVSLDDLEASLLRESTPGQPGEERPQMTSAVYVARFESGALISDPDTSLFDLTYRDDAPGKLSLGSMNLALEAASTAAGSQSPRLVTSGEGTVEAIVYQDCRLRFGWSRRGEVGPDGSYHFDLRIPPCGRTRFVVGTPEELRLEALDGVVTAYPSPPQEARGVTGETALSWYGIEAGGLTRLRLVARPRSAADSSDHLAVRQIGMDYAAAPEGLEWAIRMVVDVPRAQSLPPMSIPGAGRITAVRVNTRDVRWKETTEAGETRVQIVAPPLSASPISSPVTLEITGTAPLGSLAEERGGEVQLPQIRFLGGRPWMALAQSESLLRVAAPLRVAQLIDDEAWTIDELATGDGGSADRVYRLSGPPGATLPTLRLAVAEPWPETIAVLRLAVLPEVLRARWEAAIQLDTDGPQPLQFEFQPGWQIESVFLRSSGRIVDVPEGDDSRPLTVWPEAADVVDGVLRIQFTGRRLAARRGDLETVPPTWFTRLRGAVVRCVAAVVPPDEFDWVAGMVLRGRRIKADELSAAFAEMIGPVDGDTLLFDTDDGRTPKLQLRQPPAEFSADLHLDLQIEGDELVERLKVVCRLPSGGVPRLRVRLGPRGGRPPMRWSMAESTSGGTAFPSLEAEQVSDEVGDEEVWELSPPGSTRDQWVVVGQRRYSLSSRSSLGRKSPTSVVATTGDQSLTVPLPSLPLSQVAQATAPRATVSIGSRLSLLESVGPVLRVPKYAADDALSAAAEQPPEQMPARNSEDGWLLRYDASSECSVTVRRDMSAPPPSVVWDERIEILAGVGGGDEVRAAYRIDRGQTLELHFDPAMVVNGIEGADPENTVIAAGRLRIPAPQAGGWIHVVLWRPAGHTRLLRKFRAPAIECSAVVLQRSWRMWTAPDTYALAASTVAEPPAWMHPDTGAVAIRVGPRQSVWLLSSGVAWAAGGALALLLIGVSGWLLGVAPWFVAAGLASLSVIAILVPVWSTAIAGFLLMPLAIAGVFASSRRVGPSPLSHDRRNRSPAGGGSSHARSSASGERTLSGVAPQTAVPRNASSQLGILWVIVALGFAAAGHAAGPQGGAQRDGEQSPTANERGESGGQRETGERRDAITPRAATGPLGSNGRGETNGPREGTAGEAEAGRREGTGPREAGDGGEGEDGGDAAFPVMIPLNADGEVFGDKVYVPKAFYDSLFETATSDAEVGEMEFLSAAYQVRVAASADRRVADSVTIEAVWRVEIDASRRLVRLPIDPAALDRLEVVVDSVPNEVRPRPDGKSILIRPPRAGLNILRATLSPQVEINSAGGASGFEMRIPAVAFASLSLSTDGSLSAVNLPNCFGRIEGAESGNRMTASLGPVPDLVLHWQRGSTVPSASGEVERRWWVHAGAEHVSRELEIAVGDVGRSGVIVELTGHGDAEPLITTPDWTLDGTRTGEPMHSPLRLVSRVATPGPIRLLWVDSHSLVDGGAVRLPDIRPASFIGEIATSVAVDAPEGGAVDTSVVDQGAAQLEVADFFEQWEGYRGAARSAWRYGDVAEVELRILPPPPRSTTASESQDLIVDSDHLRISYRGLLHADGRDARPLRLLLPTDMRIERLHLNGQSTAAVVLPSAAERRELLLPQPSATEPTEIHLSGVVPLSDDGEFAPPRIRLSGVAVEVSRYRMFRGEGLQVRQLAAPPEIAGAGDPLDYDLLAGTAPLHSWTLAAGHSPTTTHLGGRFHVAEAPSHFAAKSLTTLHWEDGLWTMEVTIDVEDFDNSATFLTVEVPTRWIDGLNVQPAAKWSSQPANDPAVQLIRILPKDPPLALFAPLAPLAGQPSAEDDGDLRIRITSTLESGAEGGVSVPDIRLLGEGPRTRFFSAPRRLTSTPIEWRTHAHAIDPPVAMQDVAPPSESHQFYEVSAGESLSATLRPVDDSADLARSTLADVALFPHDTASALALMRWDLLPGNQDRVQFSIPVGARVLGVWSSGTPTEVRLDEAGTTLDVPVGLSRLAQQIVLLVTLPKDTGERQLPLPQLIGVPVSTTWAARYDASVEPDGSPAADDSKEDAEENIAPFSLEALLQAERMLSGSEKTAGQWREENAATYRRAVATATIDALDASVDNVAERPTAEKRHWLRPWFARLRQLGWPGVSPSSGDAETTSSAGAQDASPVWAAIDPWAPRFLQRVLGSDSDAALAVGGMADARWWIPPRCWSASRWMAAPGAVETIPASMVPPSIAPSDPVVRSLRVGWIGLLTFVVAAVSLRLTGAAWLMYPAVWLVMLALLAVPLLPLPVVVAIAALGLASPLLGRR